MAEGEILSCRLICAREINCSCHWCLPQLCSPPFPAEPSLHPSPALPPGNAASGSGEERWGRDERNVLSHPVPLLPLAPSIHTQRTSLLRGLSRRPAKSQDLRFPTCEGRLLEGSHKPYYSKFLRAKEGTEGI